MFEPLIDVVFLGVTNVLPAPAVFDSGLMGTCLSCSLIKLKSKGDCGAKWEAYPVIKI